MNLKALKLLLTSWLMLCFFWVSYSQNSSYNFTNYSVSEGLPSSQVYDILEDHLGFIWITTDQGLSRFDGQEFQNFTIRDGLNTNVNYHIVESDDHEIWVCGKDKGLCFYDNSKYESDPVFSSFEHNDKIAENIDMNYRTLSIHPDSEGVEICSAVGASSPKRIFISHLGTIKTLSSEEGIDVIDDERGIRISNYYHNLDNSSSVKFRYNQALQKTSHIIFKPFNSTGVFRIAELNDRFFLNIQNELYSFQDSLTFEFSFPNRILDISSDLKGNLFVGCRKSGLFLLNNMKCQNIIPDIYCSKILIDKNGGIWVGSLFNGIYYSNVSSSIIQIALDSKTTNLVGVEDKIIFTNDKFKSFELEKETISEKFFDFNVQNVNCLKSFPDESKIVSAVRLSNNQFSYNGRMVFNFNIENAFVIHYQGVFRDFIDHKDGYLLVNSASLIKTDSEFRPILKTQRFTYGFNSISEFSDKILLSTEFGIKAFEKDSLITDYKIENDFLQTPQRKAFEKDNLDEIFVSKYHGIGVERFDSSFFIIEEGLISNTLLGGKMSNTGDLFVWSNKGFSVIDENYQIENYDKSSGLNSDYIIDLFSRNDTAWVATDKGISIIDLNEKSKLINPKVLLTEIQLSNEKIPLDTVIQANYDQRFIDVSFQGLNYSDLGNSTYRYILEGHNDEWIETKETKAHFSDLSSGKFKFKVSMKLGRNWSEPITLFSIIKKKAFWQTSWFIAMMALICLCLIYLYFKRRIHGMRQDNELKSSIVELERKALQAQMNPHFVFNSLTSLQSLILDHKNQLAEEYLIRFSRLTRQTLNHSSKKSVLLKDEISLISNFIELELLRFKDKFEYSISVTADEGIMIPPMLIQPFIENAILHGLAPLIEKGKLTIHISEEDEKFVLLEIMDNGIGVKKAAVKKTHHSKGIEITKRRLELLDKESELIISNLDDTLNNSGTKVIIKMPYFRN